jgi:hypothetical protein
MKYLVLIREKGQWVEQGDGPLTLKQAERIAREIQADFGVRTRAVPVDQALALGAIRREEN